MSDNLFFIYTLWNPAYTKLIFQQMGDLHGVIHGWKCESKTKK